MQLRVNAAEKHTYLCRTKEAKLSLRRVFWEIGLEFFAHVFYEPLPTPLRKPCFSIFVFFSPEKLRSPIKAQNIQRKQKQKKYLEGEKNKNRCSFVRSFFYFIRYHGLAWVHTKTCAKKSRHQHLPPPKEQYGMNFRRLKQRLNFSMEPACT